MPKAKTDTTNAFSGFTPVFIIIITHLNKNYENKKEGHAHVPLTHNFIGNAFFYFILYFIAYQGPSPRIHHSMIHVDGNH